MRMPLTWGSAGFALRWSLQGDKTAGDLGVTHTAHIQPRGTIMNDLS